MPISLAEARSIYTLTIDQIFTDKLPPISPFTSLAKPTFTNSKEVGWDTRRFIEGIAIDQPRGGDGQRNNFGKATEKITIPPFFHLNFDITQMQHYDRFWSLSGSTIEMDVLDAIVDETSEKLVILADKIRRAKELMWCDIMKSGIYVSNHSGTYDFGRLAASKEDIGVVYGAERYWNSSSPTILADLIRGAKFIRTYGKARVNTMIPVICGERALTTILSSDEIKANIAISQNAFDRVRIQMPQLDAAGFTTHGLVAAGNYTFVIMGYTETYDASSTSQGIPYWDDDYVVMMAPNTPLTTKHAGVPAIKRDMSNAEFSEYISFVGGEFTTDNFIDAKAKAHQFEIMSAFIAVPTAVDQIFTMKVTTEQGGQQV